MAITKIACKPRGSSGVYHGFAEPPGVGVICTQCSGTGYTEVELFKTRRVRADIRTVRRSRGSFIGTGVGPTGGEVTYQEFLAGKMPS